MKKITLLFTLLFINTVICQTTHNLNWQIGSNGASASLTIDVGDTVIWTWMDSSTHTVTSKAGSQENFDSGFLTGNGTTFSHTFTQVGVNDYQCNVHAGSMFGTITVVSATPTCDDPSNLMSMNLTDDSVDISWTENGTATEWEIEYDPAGFIQGNGTLIVDNDGMSSISINSLSSSTPYDVYLRSICSSAESNWVGPFSFTTLAEPCLEPSNLISTNITENSADISWTENGTANQWEIEYGLSGFTLGNGTTVIDDDGTLGETITSLDQDTPYDYYVRSLCGTSESLWVGPSSFTTSFLSVENRLFSNFSFYPNPVKNKIFVNNDKNIQQVEIFNLLGQLVFVEKPSSKSFILNIEMLKSDFYLLKVTQNDRQRVFTFIKE